jgi:hypothetical protein
MSFLLEFGLPELLIAVAIIYIFFGFGHTGRLSRHTEKDIRSPQDEAPTGVKKKG